MQQTFCILDTVEVVRAVELHRLAAVDPPQHPPVVNQRVLNSSAHRKLVGAEWMGVNGVERNLLVIHFNCYQLLRGSEEKIS